MKNKLFQSNLFIYFQENLYGFTRDVPLAYIQCQINAPGEHPVVFIDPLQRLPFTKSNKSWSHRRLLRSICKSNKGFFLLIETLNANDNSVIHRFFKDALLKLTINSFKINQSIKLMKLEVIYRLECNMCT